MSKHLVKMRVLKSFGSLVDGVAICPGTGTIIERGVREAHELEKAGVAEQILTPEDQLVRAAKKLGVGLITDKASIIKAATHMGVGTVKPGK